MRPGIHHQSPQIHPPPMPGRVPRFLHQLSENDHLHTTGEVKKDETASTSPKDHVNLRKRHSKVRRDSLVDSSGHPTSSSVLQCYNEQKAQ